MTTTLFSKSSLLCMATKKMFSTGTIVKLFKGNMGLNNDKHLFYWFYFYLERYLRRKNFTKRDFGIVSLYVRKISACL